VPCFGLPFVSLGPRVNLVVCPDSSLLRNDPSIDFFTEFRISLSRQIIADQTVLEHATKLPLPRQFVGTPARAESDDSVAVLRFFARLANPEGRSVLFQLLRNWASPLPCYYNPSQIGAG
jgi:hypothetical protein